MNVMKVPGFAACIVKNGEVVWAKGYGWASIEEHIPATPDTVFMTGSIAKTIVATAVMQLYEQGLIGLDADVNDYLPFPVRNPNHPDTPITARMLLTYTSSIKDNEDIGFQLEILALETEDADSPISLREFLEGYLTPDGLRYDATMNFDTAAPGERWNYSNYRATLAAYLVEVVSEQPFDEYCNASIFQPLGMDETSYRLRDLDAAHIAVRYDSELLTNCYRPLPHVGHPIYPVGFLRTSVTQFARFLGATMNGGELDGVRILRPETIEEMLTPSGAAGVRPPLRDQALAWMYLELGGQVVVFHDGGFRGCSTATFFLHDERTGVAWFANSLSTFELLFGAPNMQLLNERLLEEAEKY